MRRLLDVINVKGEEIAEWSALTMTQISHDLGEHKLDSIPIQLYWSSISYTRNITSFISSCKVVSLFCIKRIASTSLYPSDSLSGTCL
jgi:hypothetical protein